MTQDERWLLKYNEVKEFIERERRNPSTGMGDRLLMCGKWCGEVERLECRSGSFEGKEGRMGCGRKGYLRLKK